MEYILKHFDTPLLQFTAEPDAAEPNYSIRWVNENAIHLLPLDLEPTVGSLEKWIRHRTIPRNRAFVHDFLAKCGLNLNRPMNIVAICKGLSLNDCYWITTTADESTFADINLYDNPLSQVLASLVFTGYGSSIRSFYPQLPCFNHVLF